MSHSSNFDRTYRAFYKAYQDTGNYREATKYKILELDFKRSKAKGVFNKIKWDIDKYFWGYGREPRKIICFTIMAKLCFGIFYSFFSELIISEEEISKLTPIGKFLTSLYCSV